MIDKFYNSSFSDYVIYTGIALGALLLFTGLSQFFSRGENASEARSRRLKMISEGATTADILAVLKPENQRTLLSGLPLLGNLPEILRKAGFSISPAKFILFCWMITLAIVVTASLYVGAALGMVAGGLLGFVFPVLLIRSKVKKHDDLMTSQLPDALDLMARGLRVGHPLNTSIQEVATEMSDPIASEFGVMFDQISYGDDLVDAFREFAERVDLEDVHYLAASIGIQHGTGGDLARIIQILSGVVRGRITMRRQILAISSEGRLSGAFLSLLPVLIFVSTSIMSPDYYLGVMEDPLFMPMAAMIILFTVINFLAIRKLVNFKI
jgi:tight adherence protein B